MDCVQEELTLQQSESCTAAPHVSVRPLLESVWEMLMSVTAGRNSSPAFATLGHDGSWLKTCLGSYQLTMDGSLEKYCEPWPKRGILLDGNAGELPTLGRHTAENGCLSLDTWPTPTAIDHATENMKSTQQKAGSSHSLNLPNAVHWSELWPTPRVQSKTGPSRTKTRQGGEDLQTSCMWATPKASDYKGSGPVGSKSQLHDVGRKNLKGMVMEPDGGQLNPDWVEALMGYEPGWTELPENWKPKSGRREKGKNNMIGSLPE